MLSAAAVLARSDVTEQADTLVRQFNVRIPMRDGITLSADIYRPANADRVPVVLVRTPYTKHRETTAAYVEYPEQGRWWAERGYAFVVQDVRGRGDSDGSFYPLVNEAADGFDTLAWLGEQPWSSGRIGMIGSSYLGWTQVYAAGQRSPYLKAIIPTVTPPDPDRHYPRQFGLVNFRSFGWLIATDGRTSQELSMADLDRAVRTLPLRTLDARMGRDLPVWRDWVAHPPGDPYWQAQRYQEKLLHSNVPALHVTGWYDGVFVGTTENFINMSERASDPQTRRRQHLLIGPWEHDINKDRRRGAIDFGPEALIDFRAVQLRWFDRWLKEIDNGADRGPRVRVFAMGANRWLDEDEWPIARTRYVKYHLRSKGRANTRSGDGVLSRTAPRNEPPDRFRYDPSNPVPFLNQFKPVNGPEDYGAVETRPDVLVYTSEAMAEPTLVCGPLRVKLFAATSAVDTDWTARVLEVLPDGQTQRLSEGIVRARFREGNVAEKLLTPGQVYSYDIDVWSTCIELQKDRRVRLEISSSMFPRWDRNPNTGGRIDTETRSVVAEQTVLHDRRHASYLLLPIVPARR